MEKWDILLLRLNCEVLSPNQWRIFSRKQRLRQGDPMSPFRFVLAMEELNHMLRLKLKQLDQRLWIYQQPGHRMEITHLLYADYSPLFVWLKWHKSDTSVSLFLKHSLAYMYWSKSSRFPVNEVPDLSILAGENLGCQPGSLPTTYLGRPFGAKSKSTEIWNDVTGRCNKKTVRWKSKYLSLDAFPTCMVCLFHFPRNVEDRLDTNLGETFYGEVTRIKKHEPSLKGYFNSLWSKEVWA